MWALIFKIIFVLFDILFYSFPEIRTEIYMCGCMLHFSPAKSMAAAVCYIFHQQSLWLRLKATFLTSKVYGCGSKLHFSPAKSMAAAVCYTFHQQSLWLHFSPAKSMAAAGGYIFHQQSLWLRLYATFFPSRVYGCGCMLHFSPAKSMAAAECYIFSMGFSMAAAVCYIFPHQSIWLRLYVT